MRAFIALIFFILALWRGWIDYTLTLGQGQAYRMISLEATWEAVSPATYETWFPILSNSDIPILWEPVLKNLFAAPAAVVFFVLALFFFGIRKKNR